jgi:hypothetical protein
MALADGSDAAPAAADVPTGRCCSVGGLCDRRLAFLFRSCLAEAGPLSPRRLPLRRWSEERSTTAAAALVESTVSSDDDDNEESMRSLDFLSAMFFTEVPELLHPECQVVLSFVLSRCNAKVSSTPPS